MISSKGGGKMKQIQNKILKIFNSCYKAVEPNSSFSLHQYIVDETSNKLRNEIKEFLHTRRKTTYEKS